MCSEQSEAEEQKFYRSCLGKFPYALSACCDSLCTVITISFQTFRSLNYIMTVNNANESIHVVILLL